MFTRKSHPSLIVVEDPTGNMYIYARRRCIATDMRPENGPDEDITEKEVVVPEITTETPFPMRTLPTLCHPSHPKRSLTYFTPVSKGPMICVLPYPMEL